MAKFRVTAFDPVLLLAQMAAMQSAYYVVAGALAALAAAAVTRTRPSLDVLFNYRRLGGADSDSWLIAVAFLVAASAG